MTMRLAFCLCLGTLLAACQSFAPIRTAPPEDVFETITVPGVANARFWGDGVVSATPDNGRVRAALLARWEEAGRPEGGLHISILALSGGGPDGAFAAGLLNGWTRSGTRPEFTLVTGISIGALIAPFAFLGPEYDPALRILFTEFDTSGLVVLRPFRLLFGALGVIDNAPLRATLRSLVDDAMLKRVAAAHEAGRTLLIGTTNIDAGRPVIWNMGEIARAGNAKLFTDVMLASASIPGAFPPVQIDVEIDGRAYSEFHVDGGVTRSVILWPTGTERVFPQMEQLTASGTVYVIQNNQLLPPYRPVSSSLRELATRSLSTLIRGQTEGDLTRIYLSSRDVGYDFRMIFVPPGEGPTGTTDFNLDYMRNLFREAERIGLGPIPWFTVPPGIAERPQLMRDLEAAFTANSSRPPDAPPPVMLMPR